MSGAIELVPSPSPVRWQYYFDPTTGEPVAEFDGKVIADEIVPAVLPANIITPEQFGADPTGVQDSTAALQAFFNALGSGAGKWGVMFPNGIYSHVLGITAPNSGYSLEGNGATIRSVAGTAVDSFHFGVMWSQTASHFNVRNLIIDGNRAARVPANIPCHDFFIQGAKYGLFSNCRSINSCVDGWYLDALDHTATTNWPRQITLLACSAFNAFRNGCSFIVDIGCRILGGNYDSSNGTIVGASLGIDIEADAGTLAPAHQNLVIDGVGVADNHGAGLQISSTSAAGGAITVTNVIADGTNAGNVASPFILAATVSARNLIGQNYVNGGAQNAVNLQGNKALDIGVKLANCTGFICLVYGDAALSGQVDVDLVSCSTAASDAVRFDTASENILINVNAKSVTTSGALCTIPGGSNAHLFSADGVGPLASMANTSGLLSWGCIRQDWGSAAFTRLITIGSQCRIGPGYVLAPVNTGANSCGIGAFGGTDYTFTAISADIVMQGLTAPFQSGNVPTIQSFGATGALSPLARFVEFTGGASQTLTLAASTGFTGGIPTAVKISNTTANAVTVAAAAGDTLNGATSIPAHTSVIYNVDASNKIWG